METARIAQVLDEMGTLLEVRGENPFRCRAYHAAAQALRGLPPDLSEMIADGSLAEVPGIGETLLAKISQLATTGQLLAYEELRRSTPPGLVALLRVPGLGPKKIKALHDELKVESLADLRAAAESGKIAALKGFGDKTQAKILEGITFVESVGERILQASRRLAAPLVEALRGHPKVIRAEICGSLRRRKETIGDLDLLFSSKDAAAVLDHFVKLPEVATVLAHGPTKASVRLADGVQCDVAGVSDAQYPFALHYFTGSKEHNIAMRRRALARALAQRVQPVRPGRRRPLPDRGRRVRRARAGGHPPRAARGRRRVRSGRARSDPRPPRTRRPHRHLSLPHRLERRRGDARRDGGGGAGAA